MSEPSITVCIVTFNQREWIEKCLRSVADQQVAAELRILVGDDLSDDGTSEIVARLALKYPGRIQHLHRNQRLGPFENLRNLLLTADGDFIARVDGDDFWLPGKLARQLDYLQAHPTCTAVYTNAITVTESGCRIGLFNDVGDACFDLAKMLRRGNFLNNSSILIRRGGLTECMSVDIPQIDYRAHLWLARTGWLGHLGEPLTAYRVNTRGSMVATMNDRVRELYWEAIQSVPRELVADADYAMGLADFLRRVVFRTARVRNLDGLRKWVPRVLAASPYGRSRTLALVATAIVRTAWCLAYGRVRGGPYGRGVKVLYRR